MVVHFFYYLILSILIDFIVSFFIVLFVYKGESVNSNLVPIFPFFSLYIITPHPIYGNTKTYSWCFKYILCHKYYILFLKHIIRSYICIQSHPCEDKHVPYTTINASKDGAKVPCLPCYRWTHFLRACSVWSEWERGSFQAVWFYHNLNLIFEKYWFI